MSDYLSADELADLVGCKSNQKSIMRKWLTGRRWKFAEDRNGVPKVARAYYLKKLGLDDAPMRTQFADGPNLEVRMHA